MAPLRMPLASSKFSLNSAAVAGFFGGKEAISAMATVHLYRGRRWLGWYNSPGSYTVAKRFGRMANSRFWDGLFPGPNDSPAVSFGLDGRKGPQYIAALSGTEMPTGHLAYLTMEKSKGMKADVIKGRKTKSCDVSYLAMKPVDYHGFVKQLPLKDALIGFFPIVVSVVTCIMCAVVSDWYSFTMILLGIISSGLASLVIGEGKLLIKSVENPAHGVPPGHGILKGEDGMMVIKGEERDVNAITKGNFYLETETHSTQAKVQEVNAITKKTLDLVTETHSTQADEGKVQEVNITKGSSDLDLDLEANSTQADEEKDTEPKHHGIGVCSLLLMLQFLLQLLLIPQAPLFGQIMFVVSLGVSWVYNSYLSSLEKEKIQTYLLFQTLKEPQMLRFRAGTRTTMAVFVCLLLFHKVEPSSPEQDRARRVRILRSCIANNTPVWNRWTDKVVEQLLKIDDKSTALPYLQEDDKDLPESDRKLLKDLLGDATAAFRGYLRVRDQLPDDSSLPSPPKDVHEKTA